MLARVGLLFASKVMLLLVAGLLSGSSTKLVSVTEVDVAGFETVTVKVTEPPGSFKLVGLASFTTLMFGCSTVMGTWKVSSQLHFDFVSGAAVDGPVHTLPWLLCQLVQLGRFSKLSLLVSWQRTPGIVKVMLE